MGAFSIWHLLIVLVIVILLFGTKRLKSIGGDLGNAIKGFKQAVKDENKDDETKPATVETVTNNLPPQAAAPQQARVIEGEATREHPKS